MTHALNAIIPSLADELANLDINQALDKLVATFPDEVTFSTSFGVEDQVITHLIAKGSYPIKIFTLDTGRLLNQTYTVWESTNIQFGLKIDAYYPDAASIEHYVTTKGPNAFYTSVDDRKECCHIRKVEPLKRALKGNSIWITGLRAEQSPARKDLSLIEWDETNNIIKYNPLLHWTNEDVWKYVKTHRIPYNELHDKGFVSIGCAPCTRAIREGEDFRAGRWWWEDNTKKECGLHIKQ